MRRRRAVVVAGVVAVLAVGGLVLADLTGGSDEDGPLQAASTQQPLTEQDAAPSASPADEPQPDEDEAGAGAAGEREDGDRGVDDVAPAVSTPETLCAQVTAADFTAITDVPVTLAASADELQCDYLPDEADGTFGRVTAQVPQDFTTWAAYVATQPDDDQVSHPDIADGAIVVVVDTGGEVRYVTAEVALGTTVVTWELALPASVDEAREQGTALLEQVSGTGED